MIYGVGTDLVKVARLADGLARHGERYARRLLTEAEFAVYSANKQPAHFLAKRFAAKEAVVKAMGTGFRDGMHWKEISVLNDALGKPQVQFHGRVAQFLSERGINQCHLSISDEQDYALAFAVLTV